LCLCHHSEANLQLSCQPCWLPNKEWHVPAGWRDAGFEPGTADFTVWCTTIEPLRGCGGSIGDVVAQKGMWWLNGIGDVVAKNIFLDFRVLLPGCRKYFHYYLCENENILRIYSGY